eukprot:c7349_g1_i1.p1 GENE.c7349_g1_i1~~c7349_g1_i1.p1  ORF type:complete len:387 (-),score=64.39 c7349_g1_i1:62-1222(-)
MISPRDLVVQGQVLCVGNGKGVLNFGEAIRFFETARRMGYPPACAFLARLHLHGYGCALDKSKCKALCLEGWGGVREMIMSSTFVSDDIVQWAFAFFHDEGHETQKNPIEAEHWYRLSAIQGNSIAQNRLAVMHYHGEGIVPNTKLALHWWRLSAAQGNSFAQFNLGQYLMESANQNIPESAKLLTISANQGNPLAQLNLGSMYFEGNGVNKNEEEAAKWWLLAANQGCPLSQHNLGLYFEKKGTLEEATKWWSLAAEQNLASAQTCLGRFYHQAGPQQNRELSLKWWRLAADQDEECAQFQLGWAYTFGEGVIRDKEQGMMWFARCFAHNSAAVTRLLWFCDKKKEYLRLAASEGHQIAQAKLQEWIDKPATQENAQPDSEKGSI